MVAMTARPYPQGIKAMLDLGYDWTSDAFRITLHTSTYVPNFDTDQFFNAVGNELGTAGGYTDNGQSLAGIALTTVAANSLAQVHATGTLYSTGQIIRPSAGNGYVYMAAQGGTTGGTAPTWPTTIGITVNDGTAIWTCVGRGVTKWDFTDPQWTNFSAGPFKHAVVRDTTPGTDVTDPLICCFSFQDPQSGGGGTFDITVDPGGAIIWPYT